MNPLKFLLSFFLVGSLYCDQYQVLTKREALIKLNDMCEESRARMQDLEKESLDETLEYYQELGFYQGLKEAIYIVKFIKKS